ncbi:MAG: PepSY-associated TM helix domain-containing protein, partial [Pseudomonadota bacterium]
MHARVGFHLAVTMSLVLFTGTFATISQELDWLANPAMRVTPDGEKVSMQAMVEAVRVSDPTSTILAIFEGEADYFAYDVRVIDEEEVVKSKLVDPWTGEVTGGASFFNIKYFFRQLHRYLFLPAPIGLTIVCSMAIILSISLYTGLKTSRNWRTLMTRIRLAKGVRTAVGDAHKAAGLWSVWFFLLMIATGLWYYAEFLGTDFEPKQATFSEERPQEMGDLLVDRDVTEILAAAQSAYPDLEIQSITFGGVFGRTATLVDGTVGNPIVRDRANRVYLDPISLEVLHVARDRDLGWVQWLNQIADPLHFGNFGGLAVKLIWFTFGLFMTGLSISGVWLTWRRLKSRGASRTQLSVLPILVLAGIAGSISFVATKVPFKFGIDLFPLGWFVLGVWLGGLALIGLWLFGKRLKRASGRRVSLLNAVYAALILGAGASAVHATVLQ